jgi:hypothetical protein
VGINKSDEWKRQRHDVLDQYILDLRVKAHKIMDIIIELDSITNESFIAGDSLNVLPQTVINIVCSQCTCKPNSKQKFWKAEIEYLKKVLK